MCGLERHVSEEQVAQIFAACNEPVKRPRTKTKQWRKTNTRQTEAEAETLELDEFVEAVCRVSNILHEDRAAPFRPHRHFSFTVSFSFSS